MLIERVQDFLFEEGAEDRATVKDLRVQFFKRPLRLGTPIELHENPAQLFRVHAHFFHLAKMLALVCLAHSAHRAEAP